MIILSKFAERLQELMFDNNAMTAKALAKAIGVAAPTITRYLKAERMPTVCNLVLIADYFHCSTDFLLGKEAENSCSSFLPCPPFSEQIVRLTKFFSMTFYRFYRDVGIPESTFFEWKNGTSQPTLESIVKIAAHFDCRVDFILGREN